MIEVERRYQPELLGFDELEVIWVLHWLHRNDSPDRRSAFEVHSRASPDNPLRGEFATRALVRPNLTALSGCRVLSVRDNVIEIDEIDAIADTPVFDIKPWPLGLDRFPPGCDRARVVCQGGAFHGSCPAMRSQGAKRIA